jgi:hypothetical protein
LTEQIPAEIAVKLKNQTRLIAIANLKAAAESMHLNDLFRAEGVRLLFLKGLTLAALAYRDPFLKMAVDIDLLIDPAQLIHASRLLRSAGYMPVIPANPDDRQLVRWHRRRKESLWRNGELQLDLHTRLADHPAMLRTLGINSPTQTVMAATGVILPTLAKDELFAYLCVHGASSAWFRLKWIADLAALLSREPPHEIERLYARSQELGAARSAAQALILADRIFGLGPGADFAQRLEDDPMSRWLADVAERQLRRSREPTDRLLGTAPIHWSQLGLLPGWRFKLSEGARQVRDALPWSAA